MLLHTLSVFRCVWLAGRPGSGKTALSVLLARGLCDQGWARRIITNIQLNGVGRLLGEVESMEDARAIEDAAIILDEAWMYLGRGVSVKDVRAWFAQIRHYNQYLILPSVLALTDQARSFEVRRMLNLVPVGIPLWVYRWFVSSGSDKDKGKFWWLHPQLIFPLYDHLGTPSEGFYVYTLDEQDTLEVDSGWKDSESAISQERFERGKQVLIPHSRIVSTCGSCVSNLGVVCADLESGRSESGDLVGDSDGAGGFDSVVGFDS